MAKGDAVTKSRGVDLTDRLQQRQPEWRGDDEGERRDDDRGACLGLQRP